MSIFSVFYAMSLAVAAALAQAAAAQPVEALHAADAGKDMEAVGRDVGALAALAEKHVAEAGLDAALADFRAAPWKREANGLHVWGVTRDGVSWYDAGHPQLEGLDVSEMSDIEGRNWPRLAWASGTGEGDKRFMIVFPHPVGGRAARGLHECFVVGPAGDRVLCAGAYEDLD